MTDDPRQEQLQQQQQQQQKPLKIQVPALEKLMAVGGLRACCERRCVNASFHQYPETTSGMI